MCHHCCGCADCSRIWLGHNDDAGEAHGQGCNAAVDGVPEANRQADAKRPKRGLPSQDCSKNEACQSTRAGESDGTAAWAAIVGKLAGARVPRSADRDFPRLEIEHFVSELVPRYSPWHVGGGQCQ